MTNPAGAAAREASRRRDGRFGAQRHLEASDVDLIGQEEWSEVNSRDGEHVEALASLRARLMAPTPVSARHESRSDTALLADLRRRLGVPRCPDLTVTGADLPPMLFDHPADFDPAAVAPIGNANHSKPHGGAWLSPGTPQTGSAWNRLLASEAYAGSTVAMQRRGRRPQEVLLRADAKVLRIDSREDLLTAHLAYPPCASGDQSPGHMSRRAVDFEAVAADYDALWVTDAGVKANHFPDDEVPADLYAWDIESVVILRAESVIAHR